MSHELVSKLRSPPAVRLAEQYFHVSAGLTLDRFCLAFLLDFLV